MSRSATVSSNRPTTIRSAAADRRPAPAAPATSGYWARSRRPLHALAFLLPLIVVYEAALVAVLADGERVESNLAHVAILRLFELLHVSAAGALHLGGPLIVAVLLAWHVLNRDRWRLDPATLLGMAVESIVLVLPLLVLGRLIGELAATSVGGSFGTELLAAGPAAAEPSPLLRSLAIGVGAGLYEELLFRMMAIAVIHTLAVDVAGLREDVGLVLGLVVSTVAFTVYHDLRDASGAIDPRRVVFFAACGLYFGVLYIGRGFGIAAGTHAAYDIAIGLVDHA